MFSIAARLTLAIALAACSTVTPAQTSGPLAAYSFDTGSGTTVPDVSGRGNTLNLSNGPTWTSGRSGSALSLDGANDLAIASSYNSSLNLLGRSFTLSAWIYRTSNSGWQIIVDKPYGAGHSSPYFDWSLHVENSTGKLVAFLGCESYQRVSNSSTPLNAWTHVAVTYDGSAIRHYLNGALNRTTSVTCSVTNTNSRPIRVGANGAGTEVFNGRIDDVRVYNRPLSATEIQNDMSTPLTSGASTGDSLAPTVSVTAPTGGATVSATVAITATASDNIGVAGVQFKVDGSNVGSEDQSAPYSISWNTTQAVNGSHSITATARDSAGNVRTSGAITVNVNNAGATAPTVTLTANPTSVVSGNSSTLSWSSTSANSCSASGAWSGSKPSSGSQSTGTLASSKTYTLTCTGAGGSASRSVTVNVSAAAAPAPTVTLSASPTSVASGGASSLTWSSSDASSCNASGAWSGSRPTSGSASTGALTAATNTFSLTCAGTGGSASRSVNVAVSGAAQLFGLDFPGSAATSGTIRFRFTNPLAIYPATYIWKVRPRQQNGYYTAFFWGNDGPFYWGPSSPDTYYGAHPYPSPPPDGAAHKWEISVYGDDYRSSQDVVYDRWYTQALRVWSDGSGKHHEFYWDLPDTSRVIRVNVPSAYGNIMPPSPALTFGDAPWNPSDEIMNGVMRGFQIYSVTLTVNDILAELNSPRSTANGASHIWYMNLNPTPSDIADKSGNGHNPAWVGSERPRLWSGQ